MSVVTSEFSTQIVFIGSVTVAPKLQALSHRVSFRLHSSTRYISQPINLIVVVICDPILPSDSSVKVEFCDSLQTEVSRIPKSECLLWLLIRTPRKMHKITQYTAFLENSV